jgi:hypothetical protein
VAEGYERDNLLIIQEVYSKLRTSVQAAMEGLALHRPEWRKTHEKTATEYEDLSRTLSLMNLDYNEQQGRVEGLNQKARMLRTTLHSPEVLPGEAVHTGYRRARLEETENDAKSASDRLSNLRNEIQEIERKVNTLATQSGAASSVMRYCESGIIALNEIDGCLEKELQGLQDRLGKKLDLLDDNCLSSIFHYTWKIQAEESESLFLSGSTAQVSRSPFRTACALAGVNKKWRDIMLSEDQQSLWRIWIAECDPNHVSRLIGSVQSDSTVRRVVRNHPVTLRLLSTTNTIANFFQARVKLGLFLNLQPVNQFHIQCSNGSEENVKDLIHTVGTRGHLKSLIVVGEAGARMHKLKLTEPTCAQLEHLTLVDIEAEALSTTPSQLRSLALTRNKPLTIGTPTSTRDIFNFVTRAPLLEILEVDIGIEDTPQFVPADLPLGDTSLNHMRHLKIRFSLLQNRLSFLSSLKLPSLRELTLITMPANSPAASWVDMIKFLSSDNNSHKITHLTIKDLTHKLRGDCHAGIMLNHLPSLRTLTLHDNAAAHFLEFICTRRLEYKSANSTEFVATLKEIYIRSSSISDDQLLKFTTAYSNDAISSGSSSYIQESSTSLSQRSSPLPIIEMYDCPHISSHTLDAIRGKIGG